MTVSEWQENVDSWIKKYGVRYFDVRTNTLLLNEEVGELSRLIARRYGEQSFKKETTPEEIKSKISDELADILFVISCLANQMDIDLTEAIKYNFDKKSSRDAKRHLENDKLKS